MMLTSFSMKVSESILNMVPYKPGKPISEAQREYGLSQVYKLASNENPLGPSPKALATVQQALKSQHLYPDPTQYALLQAYSNEWKVKSQQLVAGNGSDELIDLLCRIYCEPDDSILTSQAAFAAYEVSAASSRIRVCKTALTSDYRYDLPAMSEYFLKNHQKENIRLIFIAHPNNPTGTYNTKKEVDEFLAILGNRDDVLIVFDEAYTEFVRAKDYAPALDYFHQYTNVIVLRTLSKIYGLAGFRIGLMIAPEAVIEVVNRVRKPFNVNDLAQVAAIAALQDKEFVEASQRLTWKGLDYFYDSLKKLGLPYIESQGNFVMFDTLGKASEMNEALLRRGIIMRPIGNYGFPNHLRLSVGLENENQAAMKALEEVLKERHGNGNHN